MLLLYDLRTLWHIICYHMGVGLGRLGGFVHPTPAKGPQFATKSRRMVFLSAILLRLLREICEISLRLRRKCKY